MLDPLCRDGERKLQVVLRPSVMRRDGERTGSGLGILITPPYRFQAIRRLTRPDQELSPRPHTILGVELALQFFIKRPMIA